MRVTTRRRSSRRRRSPSPRQPAGCSGRSAALNTFAPGPRGRLRRLSHAPRSRHPDTDRRGAEEGAPRITGSPPTSRSPSPTVRSPRWVSPRASPPSWCSAGTAASPPTTPSPPPSTAAHAQGRRVVRTPRALAEVLNRDAVRTGLARRRHRDPRHHVVRRCGARHHLGRRHDPRHASGPVAAPCGAHPGLRRDLADAGERLADDRRERGGPVPAPGPAPGASVAARRSADWAEPVPEWGLARNAAVVVGPRELTTGRIWNVGCSCTPTTRTATPTGRHSGRS